MPGQSAHVAPALPLLAKLRRAAVRARVRLRRRFAPRFSPLGAAQPGWGTGATIALRESQLGYIITTTMLGGSLLRLSVRSILLLLSAALWPAGLSIALVGLIGGTGPEHWQKTFVICIITLLCVLAVTVRRRVLVNDVRVNLRQQSIRFRALRDGVEQNYRINVPFDQVEALLIERPKLPGALPTLRLRRRGSEGSLIVARGDEGTLLALHDRISWDLMPVQRRVSAPTSSSKALAARPTRHRAFLPLAPAEVTV